MPYKIAFLSKYPPLEGGIAAKTYWLARGLAAQGHMVHVVTHGISAGREYRIQGDESQPASAPNLWVHRPPEEMPWHIPEDDEHALALLDLTIRVIREHAIQILDTGYLVPYGIIGHLVKESTGVYHIVRHGGSDLEKFLKRQVLGTVLSEAIAHADVVVTGKSNQKLLGTMASHLVYQPAYVPDREAFAPSNAPRPRLRLAVIGKVNYYWQHKSLLFIADVMRQLTGQFECWIVGQGKGMADFQQNLEPETVSSFKWRPFVAPWEMPRLLNQLDGIFIFELGLPHPVVSNLALEAICSGVGIITDRADFAETYRNIVEIDKNQVIVISPSESSSAAEVISQWVKGRAQNIQSSHQLVSYQEYLSANEAIYANILSGH